MSSAAELQWAGPHIRVSRHIPAIDGLRAIAVLAVVIFHLDPHGSGGQMNYFAEVTPVRALLKTSRCFLLQTT